MTNRHRSREANDPHLGPPKLLTRQQTADTLNLGLSTIDVLIATGELASVKVGKARRVLAVSVDDLIERKVAESVA